jgi:hypothetical protein
MDFLTVRELASSSKEVWKRLKKEEELVITNNGVPQAIMVNIDGAGFEETFRSIRQAKAMRLLNSIWDEAAERGPLSDEEIEAEIVAARTTIAAEKDA